jgi:tellurite resistance protein TehA-like permease
MAPFYGAPPMAMLTVGAGALLVGRDVIGPAAAVGVAEALWMVGTATGLLSAVFIPYLMFTRHRLQLADALGSWLMPVVPPMVSAATGAALIVHLPAGADRVALLFACAALFGVSLFASLIVIALLWNRLLFHGLPPAGLVPTLWIVLGPLGQSVTAAALLASAAPHVVPASDVPVLDALALAYGVPTWGFAMSWMAIAAAITIRTARDGLPFSLTWWSFTFPVGTVVTGTSQLALHTRLPALSGFAVALYAVLVIAWMTVAIGTASLWSPGLHRRPDEDLVERHAARP